MTQLFLGKFYKRIESIKKDDGGYILVQGSSSLVKPLLEAGLVDELKLLINPLIVGNGERPFLDDVTCNLQFLEFKQFEKNVLLLSYKPTKI